ncbi:MAG: DUF4279 domain-containing protein [bacterium]
MKYEFYVYMRITDSKYLSLPEEITTTTNIQPTRIWHRGDLRPKTVIKEKENGWELQSKLPKEKPLREHVEHLLSSIEPSLELFKTITARYYTELSCAGYFSESEPFPEIHFDSDLVKRLAELNVNIDIDIYIT